MKRRTFLASGAMLGVGHSLVAKNVLLAQQSRSIPQMLQAGMIWVAAPAAVPLAGPPRPIANGAQHGPVVNEDEHAVFFRRVELAAVPALAALHLFAFTRYRLYVNGTYAGRGPSRFQNQRPEYDTRDITRLLQPGTNTLAILVHRDAPTGRIMSHAPGFTAVLETKETGRRPTYLATDSSWKAAPEPSFGPRKQAWASIEENIDARASHPWLSPGFTAEDWQPAVSASQGSVFPLWPRATPLQSEKSFPWAAGAPALPVTLSAPAELSLKTVGIAQAYHLLEFEASAGTQLQVTYGLPEKRTSGDSTYIAREGRQTWMGGDSFCFHQLTLRVTSGSLRLLHAEAIEVRYPFQRLGSFTSSDPVLNTLHSICARSLEILSEDSYVDCSDRERVEWMDDSPPAFDCTRVLMAGPGGQDGTRWSDPRLMQGLLRRTALTQLPDGQMKAHTCSERWDIHAIMEDRSCDWVSGVRQYYDSTGDARLVRELWPAMNRLLAWFLSKRTARGLVLAREWEVWDNPLRYQICEGAGLNALFYRALCDAAFLGSILGATRESAAYRAAAGQLATQFNNLLWDESAGAYSGALFGPGAQVNTRKSPPLGDKLVNGVYVPTVQAALLCLHSGIVPPARLYRVRKFVVLQQAGVTGVMSHYFLFKAFYDMGQPELDEQVLERMRTGWKAQVESEWQTTWEDLKGGSKVHIYGMHPAYWLSAFVLGVRVQGPASGRTLLIEPRCGRLDRCQGVVVTEFGPVPMQWTQGEGGHLSAEFTVPDKVCAIVRMRGLGAAPALLVDGQRQAARSDGGMLSIEVNAGHHTVSNLIERASLT